MTKGEFWTIMDSCRDGNTDAYFASLTDAAEALPEAERQRFRAYLAAYVEAAAECVWLDMACKVINGHVSDDTALYFALWVVSRGEVPLLRALEDPDTLAELAEIPFGNADFELLMSVGAPEEDEEGWVEDEDEGEYVPEDIGMLGAGIDGPIRKACRREIEGEIRYKNGDRYGGYDSFEAAMQDIPGKLPRLIRRAQEAGFSWRS